MGASWSTSHLGAITSMRPFHLVDLQVNGGGGVDFSSPDLGADQVANVAGLLDDGGTAAFLATVISAPIPVLLRNVRLLADLASTRLHGRLLGIHLEGPFISPDARVTGAHRMRHVRAPDVGLLGRLLEAGGGWVRMLTLAAEQPGALDAIRLATTAGVAVAVGHSLALGPDLERARAAGAVALTHLGNALPHSLDKNSNPFLAGLLARDLTATVIAEGHHLSTELLKLILRVKGADRTVLVSDAAPVAGLPPGRYEVFEQPATLTADGAVVNEAERHLVGSAASLLHCLNTVVATGEVTSAEAAAMASTRPLALLRLTPQAVAPDAARVSWDQGKRRFGRCP